MSWFVLQLHGSGYADQILTLNYRGELGGMAATAAVTYEDLRTGVNPQGFVTVNGRLAWVRRAAVDNHIYIAGQVASPVAFYYLGNGITSGTAAWCYVDVIPVDGSARFIAELDFAFDSDYVYIDAFALTPNPLDPPQVTYYFLLDIPPEPPKLSGLGFSPAGSPVIRWEARSGATYRVVYKTNLRDASWRLAAEVVATGNTAFLEDKTAAGTTQRFYRIELKN